MPSATRTITIDRPIADVFAFIADGTKAQQWRTGVLDISLAGGQGVGQRWTQGVKGPGGRRIAADFEITAFDPPIKLDFETVAGPVRPTGGYLLTASGADATDVTFWLRAEVGGLKGLLMGGSVQKTMDAEMTGLDRLKSVLEGR
jgi:uncharacterized protein YndB with AHSA1/START domain